MIFKKKNITKINKIIKEICGNSMGARLSVSRMGLEPQRHLYEITIHDYNEILGHIDRNNTLMLLI